MSIQEAVDFYKSEYHQSTSMMTPMDLRSHVNKTHEYEQISAESLKAWLDLSDSLKEMLQADPRKNVCDNTPVPYFDGIYDALKVVKRYMFKIEGKEGGNQNA